MCPHPLLLAGCFLNVVSTYHKLVCILKKMLLLLNRDLLFEVKKVKYNSEGLG